MAVFGYIFLAREKEQLMPEGVQESGLLEYAQSAGLTVDKFITEENVALRSSFQQRREGGGLFRAVQSGDTVIVMRAEWILGSVRDASSLLSVWKKNGVSLFCVNLETNITLAEKRKLLIYEGGSGLVQKLLAALLLCEGSEHDDTIKATEHIKETEQIQKREGKYRGGPVPFGWEVNKKCFLVQNPEQQRIIRAIITMREDHWSYRDISEKLKEDFNLQLSHERIRRIFSSSQEKEETEE